MSLQLFAAVLGDQAAHMSLELIEPADSALYRQKSLAAIPVQACTNCRRASYAPAIRTASGAKG